MSIRKKLLSGFIALSLLVGMTGGVSYYYFNKMNDSYSDMINRVNVILMNLKDIQYESAQQVSFLRGYLLDPVKYKENIEKLEKSNAHAAKLIQETLPHVRVAEVHDDLEQLQSDNEQFLKQAKEAIAVAETNLPAAVVNANDEVIPYGISMRTLAEKTGEAQYKVMEEAAAKNSSMTRTIITEVLFVTIGAFVLAVIIGLLLANTIVRPLVLLTKRAEQVAGGDLSGDALQVGSKDELHILAEAFNHMTDNLRTLLVQVDDSAKKLHDVTGHMSISMQETEQAAKQVAIAITTVSEGSETQAAHAGTIVTMVNDSLEQLAVGLDKAETARRNAVTSSETAREGSEAISKAIEDLSHVTRTVAFATDAIQKLGRRSEEIGSIITTITAISNQTNLLALNAAIEAARAGENGRGFAIVADEVRKLAEKSKEAAEQITELISDIQAETSVTVRTMESNSEAVQLQVGVLEKGGKALQDIVEVVEQTAGETREVAHVMLQAKQASEEVRQSIEEISAVIEEAAAVAEEVAASAEEQSATVEGIAASSQEIAIMAESLQARVRQFKL